MCILLHRSNLSNSVNVPQMLMFFSANFAKLLSLEFFNFAVFRTDNDEFSRNFTKFGEISYQISIARQFSSILRQDSLVRKYIMFRKEFIQRHYFIFLQRLDSFYCAQVKDRQDPAGERRLAYTIKPDPPLKELIQMPQDSNLTVTAERCFGQRDGALLRLS